MENHKRILGILYIISGVLQILGMILLGAFMSAFLPFLLDEARAGGVEWIITWAVPFVQAISITVIVLFAIPAVIGGWGLLNNKDWAMTLVLILGCFKLFSFPIGTAIGVYTIWVYVESNKKPKAA